MQPEAHQANRYFDTLSTMHLTRVEGTSHHAVPRILTRLNVPLSALEEVIQIYEAMDLDIQPNPFIAHTIQVYKNTGKLWNCSKTHPFFLTLIKALFCIINKLTVLDDVAFGRHPAQGMQMNMVYKKQLLTCYKNIFKQFLIFNKVNLETTPGFVIATVYYPKFTHEQLFMQPQQYLFIYPHMLATQKMVVASLFDLVTFCYQRNMEDQYVLHEFEFVQGAINDICDITQSLHPQKIFGQLWGQIKHKFKRPQVPVASQIPIYVQAVAVVQPRYSASILNYSVAHSPTFTVPRFKYPFLSPDYTKIQNSFYQGITGVTGKLLNEFALFKREWIFCNGCLLNFWSQLGKFNKTQKPVQPKAITVQQLMTNDKITLDQNILTDGAILCGSCSALFATYLTSNYNKSLAVLLQKYMKMSPAQLYNDWKIWFNDKYGEVAYTACVQNYNKNPYGKRTSFSTQFDGVIKNFWTQDLAQSLGEQLKFRWRQAADVMVYYPMPKEKCPQVFHPYIEHDPKTLNGELSHQKFSSAYSVLFRYDPLNKFPQQGNFMLQWIISFNAPSQNTSQNAIVLDNKRITIGVSKDYYGIIDYNNPTTQPQGYGNKATNYYRLQKPFSFLQGTSFAYAPMLQGYWMDKFNNLFKPIVQYLSANGLFGLITGAPTTNKPNDRGQPENSVLRNPTI